MNYLKWRKSHGFNQTQAAEIFGITQSKWSALEREGHKNALISKMHSVIAKAYDAGIWSQCRADAEQMPPSTLADYRPLRIGISKQDWASMETGKIPVPRHISIGIMCMKHLKEWVKANHNQKTPDNPVQNPKTLGTSVVPTFNISDVRTKLINGKVWFCLSDVCKAIDYANPASAINLISEDGLLKQETVDSAGRKNFLNFINEPNLYRFLTRCQLPKADAFQNWIYEEVVPSVCNTGSYSVAPVETSEEKLARLMGIRSEQVIAESKAYTDHKIQQEKSAIVSEITSKNYATLDQVRQISDGAAKRVLDEANQWAKEFEKEEKRYAALRHEQLVSAGVLNISSTDILIKEIRTPIKERVFALHGLGKRDELSRVKYTDADRVIAREELNAFKFRYGLHGWNVLEGGSQASG